MWISHDASSTPTPPSIHPRVEDGITDGTAAQGPPTGFRPTITSLGRRIKLALGAHRDACVDLCHVYPAADVRWTIQAPDLQHALQARGARPPARNRADHQWKRHRDRLPAGSDLPRQRVPAQACAHPVRTPAAHRFGIWCLGGLVTFSRVPIRKTSYGVFERRGQWRSHGAADRLLRKGFLITAHEIEGVSVVVINTHLLANYDQDWSARNRFARDQE